MRIVGQFNELESTPYRDIAVRRVRTTRGDLAISFTAPADWPMSAGLALAAIDQDSHASLPGGGLNSRDLPAFLRPTDEQTDQPAEPAVLTILDRLAGRWTAWGWRLGLFDQAADARAFYDDTRWLLVRRMIAPDAIAWRGITNKPPMRGFGVDPLTGAMTPGHRLPDFASAGQAAMPEAGPLDNVVRLITDVAANRQGKKTTADVPAPVVSIDLMRFLGHSGAPDIAALGHAARLATIIAEIELTTRVYRTEAQARTVYAHRPIAVGPANLGAFLTAQGLAYDSDAGRALAQATVGLITGACAAASAEIAAEAGPCPAFTAQRRPLGRALQAQQAALTRAVERIGATVRPGHLARLAETIGTAAAPLWAAALAGADSGLRHTSFTALQTSHDFQPLPIALQSLRGGPLRAALHVQELGNGNSACLVAPAVTAGLGMLGYDVSVQAAAIRHLRGHRSLDGAPGVSLAQLAALGLDSQAQARLETALRDISHIRHAFNRWVLGAATCDALGLDPVESQDYGFDMLAALGFTPDEIEAANQFCVGSPTLRGIAGLAAIDADILAAIEDNRSAFAAETRMADALNLVLSTPAAAPAPVTGPDESGLQSGPETALTASARALTAVGHS